MKEIARILVPRAYRLADVTSLMQLTGLSKKEAVAWKVKSLTLSEEDVAEFTDTLRTKFKAKLDADFKPNLMAFSDGPNDDNVCSCFSYFTAGD